MSFNKNFKMGLAEIDLIEDSLRHRLNWRSKEVTSNNADEVCVSGKIEKFVVFWVSFTIKKFGLALK